MSTKKEKFNRYLDRTLEHIHRVQKNMFFVVKNLKNIVFFGDNNPCDYPEYFNFDQSTCERLLYNVMCHDQSKFGSSQFEPYIEITEFYYQKNNGSVYIYPSEYTSKVIDRAIEDHYESENHHFHEKQNYLKKSLVLDSVEVVCDLQAMSQELNEDSCRKYFEEKWCPDHKNLFHPNDFERLVKFMSYIISLFEEK
jgi:hypothetical protein